MILVMLRRSNDIKNNLYRTQDYFAGSIYKNGKEVSKVYGNYMGFIEFDGVRYWDLRDHIDYKVLKLLLNLCNRSKEFQ